MSGIIGGPTSTPPEAIGPVTVTVARVAAFCQLSHPLQMALVMPSMNAPILALCIFCASVW